MPSKPRPHRIAIVAAAALMLAGRPAAAEPFDPSDGRGKRVATEVALGLVGTWVGAGLSMIASMGTLHNALEEGRHGKAALLISVIAVATCAGTMGGVTLGGHAWGGNGNVGWTTLGSCGGVTVGAGGALLLFRKGRRSPRHSTAFLVLGTVSALALPLLGAVLGYELSTHRVDDAQASGLRERPPRWLLSWSGRLF